MKKPAFTMIELVMVIVVLGILAALAIPRMQRDLRQEAADNILSAIRYTQHLALMDNKTNPTEDEWQKAFWQIRFMHAGDEWFYMVASNMDYNTNLDQNEAAIDPTNGKYMHSFNASPAASDESPNIFLTNKYGIETVDFSACTGRTGAGGGVAATTRHIAFDYLGRSHRGVFGAKHDFRTVMHADCTIRFEFIDEDIDDFSITILQETGYTFIENQDNS